MSTWRGFSPGPSPFQPLSACACPGRRLPPRRADPAWLSASCLVYKTDANGEGLSTIPSRGVVHLLQFCDNPGRVFMATEPANKSFSPQWQRPEEAAAFWFRDIMHN